jgi:crotonobetainyl-CoA:carnitine CoA-transferase CaiB-like acyl-CoA transferase
MSELLTGIRVLESAMLFNGDTVGAHLGDLGADVIKVEGPPAGDYQRYFLGQIVPGASPAHVQINRNKRSLGLNLKSDAGREVFWRLQATADVFLDGNAADACDKLGIGYEAQRARKSDIIYCQYTGYGAAGPYTAIPTHGQMMNTLAASYPQVMGDDGFLHNGPHSGPMSGMDSGGEGTAAGAIHAAFHIAAALVQRSRTGKGAYIDIAGYEGVLSQAWIAATYALNDHRIADRSTMPGRSTDGESTGALYQYYECADGKALLFCCIEPKFWRNFCNATGRHDLLQANQAADGLVDFGVGQTELRRELQAIFHTRPLGEWVELAATHDIAMGPAYASVIEAADDPHVAFRQSIHTAVHPMAGEYTFVKEAGIVAGQPYRIHHHAPSFGQDSVEILTELGCSSADIEDLTASGAVFTAPLGGGPSR